MIDWSKFNKFVWDAEGALHDARCLYRRDSETEQRLIIEDLTRADTFIQAARAALLGNSELVESLDIVRLTAEDIARGKA